MDLKSRIKGIDARSTLGILDRYIQPSVFNVVAFILLWVYILELLLNRILFRILIFIPQNRIVDIMASLTTYGGRFALNLTVLLGVFILALAYRRVIYSIPVLALIILDSAGLIKLYWGLLIVAIIIVLTGKSRILEALFLASLVAASITTNPYVQYTSNVLWLLAPLPFIDKSRIKALKWSLPLSLLLLAAVVANPYIMGQILILGMGLLSPWLLPPAVILYSLSKPSMGRYSLLLTGPRLQLSNQVIAMAALYTSDIISIKGASSKK